MLADDLKEWARGRPIAVGHTYRCEADFWVCRATCQCGRSGFGIGDREGAYDDALCDLAKTIPVASCPVCDELTVRHVMAA